MKNQHHPHLTKKNPRKKKNQTLQTKQNRKPNQTKEQNKTSKQTMHLENKYAQMS